MNRGHIACLLLLAALGCVNEPEAPSPARASIVSGSREYGYPEVVGVVRVSGGSIVGLCTGTVIGPRTVLTAKHCVWDCDQPCPEGASRAISPSSFRVLVANDVYRSVTTQAQVTAIASSAGDFSDDDLTYGTDISVLTVDRDLPVTPREVARGMPRMGDPIGIVGFGRTRPSSGSSGVKYSGDTAVSAVYSGLFETATGSRTCQGDSGGPAFDAAGRVIGITSFGVDRSCVEDRSFFTATSTNLALIQTVLGREPPCTATAEICNGADDDCDGASDPGCNGLGAGCGSDEECSTGSCERIGDADICTQSCIPSAEMPCPSGFRCEVRGCAGRCVPGSAGGLAQGRACNQNQECRSNYCWVKSDTDYQCATFCRGGEPSDCPPGYGCSVSAAGACGGCVPLPAQPDGAACAEDATCQSGLCGPDGVCTRTCTLHGDCADGWRCDAGFCAMGAPFEPGGACAVDPERCPDVAPECLEVDGGLSCVGPCDGGCPAGTVCDTLAEGERCVPEGLPLGESCGTNADCRTGVCAGTCTRVCEAADDCPSGFECSPAGAVSGCFPIATPPPPPGGGGGGCATSGPAPGAPAAVLWALLGLAWLGRRRR